MNKSMRSNPIIALELRRSHHPSLRLSAGLAIALWIASACAIWFFAGLIRNYRTFSLVELVPPLAFIGITLSPLVTTAFAATSMARTMHRDQFGLLRLSTLSDAAIARGYALATLYRLRVLLVLVAGLAPMLTLRTDWFGRPSPGFRIVTPQLDELLATIPMIVWVTGLHVLGAALGVGLVLRWGKPGLRLVLVLLATVLIGVGLRTRFRVSFEDFSRFGLDLRHMVSRRGPSIPIVYAAVLLLPYGLGEACARMEWREFGERHWRRAVEFAALVLAAATLLIADTWAVRSVADYKKELIAQMGGSNHEVALEAVHTLRAWGWLMDGTLKDADLEQATLGGANLRGSDLGGVEFSGADLREADLRGADLSYARLNRANLQGAMLEKAILEGTVLPNAAPWRPGVDVAQFTDAEHPDFWQGNSLAGKDLSGADLRGANLQYGDLRGADLHGAVLTGANLQWANLANANLQEADLSYALLEGAWLADINLQGADLSHADLKATKLESADLRGADLSDTNLKEADLGYADLRDVRNLTCEQLAYALESEPPLGVHYLFEGTTLPDGTQLPVNAPNTTRREELKAWCSARD